MKKTKKHLVAALAEADARIARLRDELTTTRRLNDELRESLAARNSAYNSLKQQYQDTDECLQTSENEIHCAVHTANSERRAWTRLHAAELAKRIGNDTIIGDLRRRLRDARARLDSFTECAKELDKNRVDSPNGVYVKNADLLELRLRITSTEYFIKDPVLKQSLKWDESDSN